MYLYKKNSCHVYIIKNNVKVSKSRTCSVNILSKKKQPLFNKKLHKLNKMIILVLLLYSYFISLKNKFQQKV